MLPLAYHDQCFVPLKNSHQPAKISSLTQQYTDRKLNEPPNQPVTKEQFHATVTAPPLSSKMKAHSYSVSPTSTSKMITAQGSYNRTTTSSLSYSKCPIRPSPSHYSHSSLRFTWKSLVSSSSHSKTQTTRSANFNKGSSLKPNKTSLNPKLLLPKPQTTSSNLDLCWKTPLLKSAQSTSTSSLSSLQYQETPLLNVIWTSPSLLSTQSVTSSTVLQSKSEKASSLDSLWTSSLECNQGSLSSSLNNQLQEINFLPTSTSSLESNRMAQSSPFPESRPQKLPISNSNNNVLSLPMSQLKSRKSSLLSQSAHPPQSSPLVQPKSKIMPRSDRNFWIPSSPVCKTKLQNTTSQNDKYRAPQLPTFHIKPDISSQRLSSAKPHVKNSRVASVMNYRVHTKESIEFSGKPESDKEILWSLGYKHPCIIKGGTVPVDILNKIVNSISKSTIQKDLCRQILFRRMRGKPNPRPGPRLSSVYTVCLDCASYVKPNCIHLTGKKDPRCASLFVIPTPEINSDGKVEVKLVLILSLPETPSSPHFQLPVKDKQSGEAVDDNIEEVEKITQFFPASKCDIIQELMAKNKCSAENKVLNQEPQAVDWLLYVKNSSTIQPQSQYLTPSSSSCSSFSSSSSSSSSSSGIPSPSFLYKDSSPLPLSDFVITKIRSYHRLPPGVSWLEFISGKGPENPKLRQSSPPQTKHVRTFTMKKMKRETNTLLRYLQTKFQTEKL